MKRLLFLLLSLSLVLLNVSCGAPATEDVELRIVTTVFPQYDFVRAICADSAGSVSITMLLPPGSESHDYEPSLSDLKLIGECDLFICVGGETDSWVEDAVAAVGSEVNVMRLTEHVELLCEEDGGILDTEHSHEHGEPSHDWDAHTANDVHSLHGQTGHEHKLDEHVWTTAENAAILTEAICDELCRLRPSLANSFRSCGGQYAALLRELDGEYLELCESASRNKLYFADRFPFRYLTEHCSLEYEAAFSGCSSDSEPSLSVIAQLTRDIKANNVPLLLTTEFSSQSAPRFIADEAGCEIATLHSYHNVSREDFETGVTYLELARQNLSVLRRALS